ncbi:MAG: 30S ribosomal protein S20 [Candidatus Rokuibacteriota bacterium]
MANTRSALKRMRQSEKRRVRNTAVRSGVRTTVKTFRTALRGGSVEEARASLARTIQILDKAVTKGVLPKNAAARRKSRLTRQLNALAAR